MCIFCSIVRGESAASFLHQDDRCVAFLNTRPINPGEFMVIPREHIDHFTDIPDDLAGHIMIVGQRLGRRMLTEFKPARVGYVVHGFGVPHAHLNVVPQHEPIDIVSSKHVVVEGSSFRISDENLASPSREELDAIALRFQ